MNHHIVSPLVESCHQFSVLEESFIMLKHKLNIFLNMVINPGQVRVGTTIASHPLGPHTKNLKRFDDSSKLTLKYVPAQLPRKTIHFLMKSGQFDLFLLKL